MTIEERVTVLRKRIKKASDEYDRTGEEEWLNWVRVWEFMILFLLKVEDDGSMG